MERGGVPGLSGPPTPRAFREIVKQASERLTHDRCGEPDQRTGQPRPLCIGCQYEWDYHAAHDRSVGDSVKVALGGVSDPTGNVVMAKSQMRRALRQADNTVKAVLGLEGLLSGAMKAAEVPHTPERHFVSDTQEISDESIRESRAAKVRRESRHEGWGAA